MTTWQKGHCRASIRWAGQRDVALEAVPNLLLALLSMMQSARAQSTAPAFDSGAVESATVIAGGVCSNPVIGVSYRLPEGMKPQDAAALRQVASAGARAQGIGPEA